MLGSEGAGPQTWVFQTLDLPCPRPHFQSRFQLLSLALEGLLPSKSGHIVLSHLASITNFSRFLKCAFSPLCLCSHILLLKSQSSHLPLPSTSKLKELSFFLELPQYFVWPTFEAVRTCRCFIVTWVPRPVPPPNPPWVLCTFALKRKRSGSETKPHTFSFLLAE